MEISGSDILLVKSSRTDWSRKLNPKVTREYVVPVLLKAITNPSAPAKPYRGVQD